MTLPLALLQQVLSSLLCLLFWCACTNLGCVHLGALAGESAEDAPLGHLQAGGDGRDSGERGGQSSHVGLHVAQQLLQLVQHCDEGATGRKHAVGGRRYHLKL